MNTTEIAYEITHYGNRFFAVYAGDTLIAVTVYRKGAESIVTELRQRDQQLRQLREVAPG